MLVLILMRRTELVVSMRWVFYEVRSGVHNLTWNKKYINTRVRSKVNETHYRPGQVLRDPGGCESPRFQNNRHTMVVRLSALFTGRLYSPGNIPGTHFCCRPGSSVGISTDYGLDGPGIEFRWGRDFPPVQIGPGTHPASCKMGSDSFQG